MAISDNYAPIRQIGNGVTTQFSASWNMISSAYALVYLENSTTHVQTAVPPGPGAGQYTITVAASGFTVTFGTAPTASQYAVIGRSVSLDQTDPYRTSKGYQGEVLESSLDKITAMIQDLGDISDRSLKFPLGSSAIGILPTPVDDCVLAWSSTSGLVKNGPTTASLIAGAASAAASAAAAAASAAAANVNANTIDVFLTGGQSNMSGVSDGPGPTVPTGKVLRYYSGTIADANDPVGPASAGSSLPMFGITYNAMTGRKICFVPASVGGSAQAAAADTGLGNWDAAGALYGTSLTLLNAAMTALRAAGYNPIFRGIYWSQGETDASGIQGGTITKAVYKAALIAMLVRYRSATIDGGTFPDMPFYISKTGNNQSGTPTDANHQLIRDAQEEVAEADTFTKIVHSNAQDFIPRSMQQAGGWHYNQKGYNEMGRVSAIGVVTDLLTTMWQRSGSNSFGFGTMDLYYNRGGVSVGSAVISPGVGGIAGFGSSNLGGAMRLTADAAGLPQIDNLISTVSADVSMYYKAKGAGAHIFYSYADTTARIQFNILSTATSVNYPRTRASIAGSDVVYTAAADVGGDTNISINLVSVGTGVVKANGNQVATQNLTLAQFASTSSAQLRTLMSDETGTGALVFAGGNIGAATATSINFGQTSLNWYEEGVWTPTIRGSTTAGTPTYASNSGTFTRIGRYVHLQGILSITAFGGAPAGTAQIGGLPYTVGQNDSGCFSFIRNTVLDAGNTMFCLDVPAGGTIMSINEQGTNTPITSLPIGNLSATTFATRFAASYQV